MARIVTLVVCLLGSIAVCDAADEEIQVYDDSLSEPGRFGLDLHNNFVLSGSRTPDYPGQQPP